MEASKHALGLLVNSCTGSEERLLRTICGACADPYGPYCSQYGLLGGSYAEPGCAGAEIEDGMADNECRLSSGSPLAVSNT